MNDIKWNNISKNTNDCMSNETKELGKIILYYIILYYKLYYKLVKIG